MTQPQKPCRRYVGLNESIGRPCPDCGHTDLVHPGGHNPSIDACRVCQLEVVLAAWTALPERSP